MENETTLNNIETVKENGMTLNSAEAVKEKVIPLHETVISLCVYVLSFVFVRYVSRYFGGIWGGIFWLLFGAAGAVFVKLKSYSVKKTQIFVFAISELFCFTPLFCTNAFINFLAAVFSYALDFYLLVTIAGGEMFGRHFIRDMLYGIFVRPFLCFVRQPVSAFSVFKKIGKGKSILYALLGILLAIPLTAVVAVILMESDTLFKSEMQTLFKHFPSVSFSVLWQLIIAVPCAMYFFGAFCSVEKRLSADSGALPAYRVIPPVIAYFAVTPICIFYFAYTITQVRNIANAVNRTLDYSEFARHGFFELCAITVINLLVIVLIQTFAQRNDNDKKPLAVRIYTVILSAFTLMIIATALVKMFMYIAEYGMTLLRVYTSWFMILEAIIFVPIIILQFKDFVIWKPLFCIFTVMFALLCFGNFEGKIASYNIHVYENGSVAELDVQELSELGFPAVAPTVNFVDNSPAYSALDEYEQQEIKWFMENQKDLDDYRDKFAYFSIPRLSAQKALEFSTVGDKLNDKSIEA